MKANKFFAVALAALALVACNKENGGNVEVTKISLNQATLTLEKGASATLVATVEPEGAAKVVWSSQDESIVTVDEGKVTAVAEGSTLVVAKAGTKSASCLVTVGKGGSDSDAKFANLLTGSDYYVIALDEVSSAKIAGKITGDFRMNGEYVGDGIPEETTSVLEIWGNTFGGGAGGGLNCFGLSEGYISLVSQTGEGWGLGCGGIRQTHRMIDLTKVTADHVIAIAYKCPANNQASAKAKFTFYSTQKGKPEVAYEVNGNTNGEWELLEIKVADLFAKGVDWTQVADCMDGSYAWYSVGLLIEGIGNGLDVDAILIYKK